MKTLENRFWNKVDKRSIDVCWYWNGYRDKFGHGQIGVGRRGEGLMYAHRLSYELHNNIKIGKNLCVCHKCDIPYCVNPNHLFLGSKKDNSTDMVSKGRHIYGEKQPNSKLKEDDILNIRKMYSYGGYSQTDISKMYGVSRSLIGAIINRKRWGHI